MLTLCRAVVLSALLCAAAYGGQSPPQLPRPAETLKDLQAVLKVSDADIEALRSINADFATAYRLKDVTMSYKSPDRLRMESRIGTMILNGAKRYFSVPALGLRKTDDVGLAPGKRRTLLDVGLLPTMPEGELISRFVKSEPLEGRPTHLFELTFKSDPGVKYRIWLDTATHVTLKRDWLDREGALKATFRYSDLKKVAEDLWIPMRAEVRNGEGRLAGVTTLADLKVNVGLADELFEIAP
jgi:outer membrane lipoprotein-sorting protein